MYQVEFTSHSCKTGHCLIPSLMCKMPSMTGHLFSQRFINYPPFSSSLVLYTFKPGLGFPHNRYPFWSVQCSHSPTVHNHIFEPNLTSSIHLSPGLPCFSPFSCFVFQQLLYCSYSTHSYNKPQPFRSTYFNYSNNIWRFKCIINLINFYSAVTIFIHWPIIFLKDFPFPHH